MSNWADSIYSKLDTKNQGYIEKSDLQEALSKVSGSGGGSGQSVNVDDTFSALDGDSDGKVTKSELTDAMTRLSDQLNAQLGESQMSASRVGRGGPPPEGPPPEGAPPAGQDGSGVDGSGDSTGGASATDGTSSSSADYIAAADTDGDGTVSDAEQAAYDKKVASGQAEDASSTDNGSGGAEKAGHQKDPMRELAHALHLLKAYAENSGGSDSSTASSSDASSTSGISAEA
jgi:hypothetical protein